MPQINLLKQNSSQRQRRAWSGGSVFVVRFVEVLIVLILVWYGWTWFQASSVNNRTTAVNNDINNTVNTLSDKKDRDELLTRQAQLKTLGTLISSHVYWSNFLPVLVQDTLPSVSYVNLNILSDGTAHLSGSVPSMAEFDKFLQIFDWPQVYQNFSNVKVIGISPIVTKQGLAYSFDINLNYNPNLLSYQAAASSTAQTNLGPAALSAPAQTSANSSPAANSPNQFR